ncbi:MAG: response regulator [Prolixibacteraceae bacterium]|nr:response regulator [Prolixibacteraceae bacterium]
MYGISMRETNSVVKDDNGFVWVSSKTGILRLTEESYRTYHLPYSSANIISVKLSYFANKLIAFSNNGQIFLYNDIYDQFELLISLNEELNSNYLSVSSLIYSKKNEAFWFATSNGLYKYQSNKLSLIDFEGQGVLRLLWKNEKEFIIATSENIFLFNSEKLEKSLIVENQKYNSFEVSKLFLDKSMNRLWVGSLSAGIFYFDFDTFIFKSASITNFPKQPILAIEEITDSTLWIGIDGQGIWEINKTGNKVKNIYKENIDNPFSIRGNGVYDIYREPNKRVWVSTYSGGVSYCNVESPIVTQITHLTNNPNSLANNDVNCIIEDQQGRLWFATNNGISCWNIKTNKWNNFFVNNQEQAQVFLTLCEDNDGQFWAGTYSSGVYVLDRKTGKQVHHYAQSEAGTPFVNDFVFDIYMDSTDNVWIGGTNSQVVLYEPSNDSFTKYANQPLNVITELSKGQMLLGCTYGLCLLNQDNGNTQTLINKVLVNDILVLDGNVWVASSGDGLIRLDQNNGTIEKYTIENGLSSNFTNSLTYSDGFIWLGTETGLNRFDPVKKSSLIYSSIPFLSSVSFNRNAHFKLKNGNLAWGTNNGVVIFNPKTITQENSIGQIYIQDISLMGRSIRELEFNVTKPLNELNKVTIKHNQNNIAFELLPIGVESGSKLSWKLEGLYEEWSQPANQRLVSYTNIPSKEYILKLRLYNNSLSSIVAERSFRIEVTPPFWATYWFLIILFLAVSSVIYFVFWYYINSLKQKHTEEKVRFFTNTAHDLRTSLTLIKAPIEELSKESNLSVKGRNFINLANEQALRLSSVVTQLMDFQKMDVGKGQLSMRMNDIAKFVQERINMFESLASKKEIKINFESNQPVYKTAFDESMIEKVVDNLISNAIKYSFEKGTIKVNLYCTDNEWNLTIKDQGIGISKQAQKHLFKEFYRGENAVNSKIVGSGIGLLLVKKYAILHEGAITFKSEENVGSSFSLLIPKKQIIGSNTPPLYNNANQPFTAKNEINIQSSDTKEKSSSKKMQVLIVEDNDDLLNFMKTSLAVDFEIYMANDGEKAWNIIQNKLPDLIVSDVMMPNKDGFELCQLVKSNFETSHIPVVLLTALSGKAEQLHGLGLGADDYLTKPFDMALLRQKIKTIIQNRKSVSKKVLKLNKVLNNETVFNNNLNDTFVKKMLEVVHENIANSSFNKEIFASSMNVSSSLLYKKVKSLTDQSPTDFIKTVRLDHALELLQSRNHNITEVSELCGYSSIGYFSTVFKKHFGISPTEV